MFASLGVLGTYAFVAGPAVSQDLTISFGADLVQLTVLVSIVAIFRRRLLANRFGRRAMLALVAAAIVVTVSTATLLLRDGTYCDMLAERNLIFAATFAVAAPELSRLLWVAAAWALVAALIASLYDGLAAPATLVTAILAVAAVVRKSTRDPDAS